MNDLKQSGDVLKSSRERLGLSINDVSVATKINPRILKALEDGQKESLPPKSFTRGFIRSYAAYLKIDAQPILDAYTQDEGATAIAAANAEATEKANLASGKVNGSAGHAPTATPANRRTLSTSQSSVASKAFIVGTLVVLVILVVGIKKVVDKYAQERVVDTQEALPVEASDTTAETTVDVVAAPAADGETAPAADAAPGTAAATTPDATAAATPVTTPSDDAAKVAAVVKEETDKAAKEKALAEKLAAEKLAADKLAAEKLAAEKVAKDKAEADRLVAEKVAKEKAAADKAAADKLAADKAAKAKADAEKAATAAAAKTADAAAASTAKPAAKGTPQEVILEALDKVDVTIRIDGEEPKKITLAPESLHTIKAKSGIEIEVSDGGTVNVIHNGRERGVAGDLGKPTKLKYP